MDERKILIADRYPLIRAGLARAVRHIMPDVTVVGASTIAEAEAGLTRSGRCKLILLAPDLPDAHGLSALIRLQYKMPGVPIVLVLDEDAQHLAGTARSFGAAGILRKDARLEKIAIDLIDILAGKCIFPNTAIPTNAAPLRDRIARLSDAQRRVLFALADGRANKQIAYDLAVTEATVKAHLTAIFRQLGVTNRMQAMLALQPILGAA